LKKNRRKKAHRDAVLGLAWYQADEWSKLLEASADRDELEETHAEWLRDAEATYRKMVVGGLGVKKVRVRVDELIEWCREEGRPVDSESRAAYAAFKLEQSRQE
jgi:hypothetical protein